MSAEAVGTLAFPSPMEPWNLPFLSWMYLVMGDPFRVDVRSLAAKRVPGRLRTYPYAPGMSGDELYRVFTAHQAARGVIVQAPRLRQVWSDTRDKVGSPSLARAALLPTEAYLLLLVANQMGQALLHVQGYPRAHLTDGDLKNLQNVRNAWEHRDEKLSQQAFPWEDKKLGTWLNATYPSGWAVVFSIGGDDTTLRIGDVVDVNALVSEAEAYVKYFDSGTWS
jgi:hypothetical protein